MTSSLTVSASRAVPVAVEDAFARVLPAPLATIFSRRYAVIPATRTTEGPEPWGMVGQSRTVVLADGGRIREELVAVEAPHRFAYRLSEISGPMRPLASAVDGEWRFEPVGTGTRITWSWTLHPASRAASYALPVFARAWRGYARQGLEEVERLLVG